MRNFRELDIWKESVQLVKKVYSVTETFPNAEKNNLVNQISRCAVSIPSNIAEGCSRNSQKDFSRYLQISLGSSFELETQIEIAFSLGYLSQNWYTEFITELNLIQRKIQSLKKYVESKT